MAELVETIKGLGTAKLAAIGGGAVLLLALIMFLAVRSPSSSGGMVPLYSNLTLEDGNNIITSLDSQGIKYQIQANGTQILVPESEVLRLRMKLAGDGLPSNTAGVGYEIFDKSQNLGTSNFVYNVNMLRALEGEIARTIMSFGKISSARVHLVMPKRELFTREEQEPSASVALKVNSSQALTTSEISAIRHLVATAVPNLKVSKITIVDDKGRLLAKGVDDPNDPSLIAETSEQYRISYENRLKKMVEELLEQSVGVDKVKAQVSAAIDFDRITTNSEEYDPDGQVVRSVQSVEEKEQSNEKDTSENVSVKNNLPDNQAGEGSTVSSSSAQKTDETTNFEITKKVTNHVKETGTVNRLSVAVLVDGTYSVAEDGTVTYNPRSDEELKKLESLVKSAIGFDAERGDKVEVVNMQFPDSAENFKPETPLDWIKDDFGSIMQTAVLGIVAILAILLVVKPLVSRALEASTARVDDEEVEDGLSALTGPSIAGQLTDQTGMGGELPEGEETLINIDRIDGKVKSSSMRKIIAMIDKHPEETLNSLRNWLRSDRGD